MMDAPRTSHSARRSWFEPATVMLMGAATLATAWSSFENSRWDGRSRELLEQSNELDRHGLALQLESQLIKTLHYQIFSELINARLAGDERRFDFYASRIGDELKPAFEKWMALRPFENSATAPHPFTGDFYTPRHRDEIRSTREEARAAESAARAAGGTAGSYLGNTIFFSAVLFFVGTARTFHQRRIRFTVLSFAAILFLFSITRMLFLPFA